MVIRNCTFGLLTAFTFCGATLHAQPWTVGVPVDEAFAMSLEIEAMCYPDPVMALVIPPSDVTGVQYIAVVTGVVPEGVFNITHQTAQGLTAIETGDTLFITNVDFPYVVYTPGNSGTLMLEFRAIGIPTVAGETYSCTVQPWQPLNGNICPASLMWVSDNSCQVQLSTGTSTISTTSTSSIICEGNWVRIEGPAVVGRYAITDAAGRILRTGDAIELINGIDLTVLSSSIYTVSVTTAQGAMPCARVGLGRN